MLGEPVIHYRTVTVMKWPPDVVFYAEYGAQDIGRARIRASTWITTEYITAIQLDEIYVDPKHRRRGIGTELLGMAHKWVQDNNFPTLTVTTAVDDTDTRAFLDAFGLTPHYVTYDMYDKGK